MKRILILMMTGLLVMALSAGAAWAKPDNAKKEEGQTKVKAMQMYKTQYKAMVDGEISVKSNNFNDTANHWGSASIQRMAAMRLFAGYDDGTFKPNNNMSQAEMIALLMRLVDTDSNDDEEEDNVSNYSEKIKEVPEWARNSVIKAANLQIMSLNRFHSAQQASRAQTCVAFAKALDLDPIDIDEVNFADKLLIDEEDLGYILAMYQAGYIKGAPGNYFLPQNGITRAEMAAILERILADLKEDDEDEDEDEVDLSDLENDLLSDYDEIENVPVDNIKLDGDEDKVYVEVEVDLDDYEDEWADLNNSDIKDWLKDLVGDIQGELSKDTIVSGKIINSDNDVVLVRFRKDGTDDLSISYIIDDVNDVEDELKGDEFDIADIEFEITSINYNEDDEIMVDLEAQEDISSSQWDDLDSSDVEDDVEIICEEIAQAFQDDADAEPVMIYINLYDEDSHLLEKYEYDVENESLD
ncbi:S-layer homology domain-containing protein [Desulfoscipio gibsoniae]|uniref:Putative S-layer protein n=1 Tax=Desulfoscipio gibsoniae DSM 7213 TaxID=767817 RepID=R4KGV8_9FIRM|nr:S-layer homology domain-containing protein [Desulfoscipio gibsoniae]AGL01844.1 putative S-layer protein [Desulfoscipio gibsoniae DSM 7213]